MSGTADVYTQATLSPSKLELLAPWLVQQSWFEGDAADLERVAFFRFVDPDGEVGLDSMLIASGGAIYHVPVTWRGSELEGGELIGTLDHSELGTRYGYDATTDPVYVSELVRVITEGDTGSPITNVETGEPLPATAEVVGSGVTPGVDAQGAVRLIRVLDAEHEDTHAARGVLTATWTHDGVEREDVLAVLR
ncbi:hypothetical protein H5397_14635 [Propioniciclava sp. MC1683]|uniref:maltokinase N-terminal cap-like domain-containing protein n=1 Tax=Propioniciclava sp. MC1683 TaxID=2760309 RepID=UPI001603E23B|nr:hypothetical protein [Propioniciclava sp. MC1683]MBB1502646.1 hypothetical protein [Propioniciclava sp. MC1683]